jgi:hypothetical protein
METVGMGAILEEFAHFRSLPERCTRISETFPERLLCELDCGKLNVATSIPGGTAKLWPASA